MANLHHAIAANYDKRVSWVYDSLRQWLAAKGIALTLTEVSNIEQVIEQARPADIFLAYKLAITRPVIAALPNLRLLMASGSGYDHIDVNAATEYGIAVTNAATHNVEDVAEHTLTLILACGRKIRLLERAVRNGEWPCASLGQPRHRFLGKTVGLVGFGNIGKAVAWRAKGIGFRALAYDPYLSPEAIQAKGVESVSMVELLQRSDFVSLHLRLSESTRHLIGKAELDLMSATAFLINTGRGGLIDERALVSSLADGKIAGAGLDVLETEPPNPSNALLVMDNVIVTGHAAGGTVESIEDWLKEWKSIIESYLTGNAIMNLVNPEVRRRTADVPIS